MSDSRDAASRLAAAAAGMSFPRLSGTEGALRIRQILVERLQKAGLAVREEEFHFNPRRPLFRIRAGLLVIAATLVLNAVDNPALLDSATLVARLGGLAAGFIFILVALFWDTSFFLGGEGFTTANVIARIGVPLRDRVVFVAHHDSKSQWPPFWLRFFLALGGLAGLGAFVFHLITAGLDWAWPSDALLVLRVVEGTGGVLLGALALFTFGNSSPGALDNAASLAILLEVANRLGKQPPADREVVFAFTGGEEHLLAGGRVLARDMASTWNDGRTRLINLDGAGAPGPLGLHGDGGIVQQLKNLAAGRGIAVRRLPFLPGWLADDLPLRRAGLRVGSLTGGALGRAVYAVHSSKDRPELLDPRSLAAASDLLEAWARADAA